MAAASGLATPLANDTRLVDVGGGLVVAEAEVVAGRVAAVDSTVVVDSAFGGVLGEALWPSRMMTTTTMTTTTIRATTASRTVRFDLRPAVSPGPPPWNP